MVEVRGMRMRLRLALALLCLVGAGRCRPLRAEEFPFTPGTKELGVRTGYSFGVTKNAQMVTVMPRFGYTLFHVNGENHSLLRFLPRGALAVVVEPFASAITETKNTAEAGLAINPLTYYFDTGTRLIPYVEGGIGAMYTDLTGFDLGGRFQFLSHGGAGFVYLLQERVALNLGGRFRHISNAGIHSDNAGLESLIFTVGVSYFY